MRILALATLASALAAIAVADQVNQFDQPCDQDGIAHLPNPPDGARRPYQVRKRSRTAHREGEVADDTPELPPGRRRFDAVLPDEGSDISSRPTTRAQRRLANDDAESGGANEILAQEVTTTERLRYNRRRRPYAKKVAVPKEPEESENYPHDHPGFPHGHNPKADAVVDSYEQVRRFPTHQEDALDNDVDPERATPAADQLAVENVSVEQRQNRVSPQPNVEPTFESKFPKRTFSDDSGANGDVVRLRPRSRVRVTESTASTPQRRRPNIRQRTHPREQPPQEDLESTTATVASSRGQQRSAVHRRGDELDAQMYPRQRIQYQRRRPASTTSLPEVVPETVDTTTAATTTPTTITQTTVRRYQQRRRRPVSQQLVVHEESFPPRHNLHSTDLPDGENYPRVTLSPRRRVVQESLPVEGDNYPQVTPSSRRRIVQESLPVGENYPQVTPSPRRRVVQETLPLEDDQVTDVSTDTPRRFQKGHRYRVTQQDLVTPQTPLPEQNVVHEEKFELRRVGQRHQSFATELPHQTEDYLPATTAFPEFQQETFLPQNFQSLDEQEVVPEQTTPPHFPPRRHPQVGQQFAQRRQPLQQRTQDVQYQQVEQHAGIRRGQGRRLNAGSRVRNEVYVDTVEVEHDGTPAERRVVQHGTSGQRAEAEALPTTGVPHPTLVRKVLKHHPVSEDDDYPSPALIQKVVKNTLKRLHPQIAEREGDVGVDILVKIIQVEE